MRASSVVELPTSFIESHLQAWLESRSYSELQTWEDNFIKCFYELQKLYYILLDEYLLDETEITFSFAYFLEMIFTNYQGYFPQGVDWNYFYGKWKFYVLQKPVALVIMLDMNSRKILLTKGPHSDRWRFPGGKLENNEYFIECAAREIKEELGLDIRNKLSKSMCFQHIYNNKEKRFFLVEGISKNVNEYNIYDKEIAEVQWIDPFSFTELTDENSCVFPYLSFIQYYIRLRKIGKNPEISFRESMYKFCLLFRFPPVDELPYRDEYSIPDAS